MTATLILFALTIRPDGYVLLDVRDDQIERMAAQEFEWGVTMRHDAAQARPHFQQAARMYDELWRRGHKNPALALNRANAYRLAGQLPDAIVALNEGLAAARWNRVLQAALEEARSTVAYPVHGDLAAMCRPAPATGIATRMSPLEAWGLAALLWVAVCAGIARFVMTRAPGWLIFSAVWFVGLALLGGFWLQEWREVSRENEFPKAVVSEDVVPRKGNADAYPARLPEAPRLPKGAEVRERTRRGGWVQIQLECGVVGWIPESSALKVEG